jgi:hypothetical protein
VYIFAAESLISFNHPCQEKAPVSNEKDGGISKLKLALGAASLFFFIVGVKRSFRRDDGTEISSSGELSLDEARKESKIERPRLRNAS